MTDGGVQTTPRDANLLGTVSLAVADRLGGRIAAEFDLREESASCLSAVATFAKGCSIEELSRVVALSHSATVRLVDRLEADGLIRRTGAPDRRAVALEATAAGKRLAAAILRARAAAIGDLLASLTAGERAELELLHEKLLTALVARDTVPVRVCRLCDVHGCGHYEGRCPVTERARELREAG